jgi:hypothetical protein
MVATLIAIALAVTLVLIHFLTGIDFANVLGRFLESIPGNHLDELVIADLIIAAGVTIDVLRARQRRRREFEIQAQRLMVFKATMRSIHELVNDALNQMQLFRMEGEGLMPEESLVSLDNLIKRTAAELTALGDLESTPERDTSLGRSIDHKGVLGYSSRVAGSSEG